MPRKLAIERHRVRSSNVQEFRFLPRLPSEAPFGAYPFMGYVSELVDRSGTAVTATSVKPADSNEDLHAALDLFDEMKAKYRRKIENGQPRKDIELGLDWLADFFGLPTRFGSLLR